MMMRCRGLIFSMRADECLSRLLVPVVTLVRAFRDSILEVLVYLYICLLRVSFYTLLDKHRRLVALGGSPCA